MTANVSRADLLAYLADHSDEALEGIIDCFGFTSNKANTKNTTTKSEPEVKINADIPKISKESKKPLKPKSKTRPDEIFYTLTAVEPSELAPETNEGQMQLPDWMADENLPPFDATDYPSSTEAIPLQQPLIVWEKLWPKLRQILSETQQKQRPDINRLVKIVADGYFPETIPRQQKQQWAASATLLIDIPDRLKHGISDYQNLLKSLKKLRGETGLQVLEIEDRVGGEVSTGTGMSRQTKPWQMPLAEEPILILSDAGLLAPTENDYEDWLHFGRKLKAANQSFWMADTAVTQAFYQAVMGENPSRFNEDGNNPVETVSWEDAQHFIKTLNQRIPNLQAGLPTEAQWEVSCRADTTTPFSFGEMITARTGEL